LTASCCSRHRKQHDKPHPCSLCKRRFGLKTDLDRHRLAHRPESARPRFTCKFPGCKVATSGKEYLWKHLKKNHQLDRTPSKHLRAYYEDFIAIGQNSQHELDLQLLETSNQRDTEKVRDLLSRGANVSAHTRHGQSPLDLALDKGY